MNTPAHHTNDLGLAPKARPHHSIRRAAASITNPAGCHRRGTSLACALSNRQTNQSPHKSTGPQLDSSATPSSHPFGGCDWRATSLASFFEWPNQSNSSATPGRRQGCPASIQYSDCDLKEKVVNRLLKQCPLFRLGAEAQTSSPQRRPLPQPQSVIGRTRGRGGRRVSVFAKVRIARRYHPTSVWRSDARIEASLRTPAFPRLPGKATTTRQPKAKRLTKECPKCTQKLHVSPPKCIQVRARLHGFAPYLPPVIHPPGCMAELEWFRGVCGRA